MAIPLFDNEAQLRGLRPSIMDRIATVVAGGRFILGEEVAAFERELAEFVGVRHAIGVANGTDALTIAARALGVGPGDDVVLPSFTFYATAEAIANTGARPVFCDVDPDTRNVTPGTVTAALTARTRAIVAVDLFGNPAPIPALRKLGLPVIEDAAQALGASLGGRRAGSLGTVATISFYPSKNLGAFGDGGAVLTDSDELAETARALRFHGSRDKRTFEYIGYNSRLDELQAAVLRVLLPALEGWCDARRLAAERYAEAGVGDYVGLTAPTPDATPAWHLYVVTHPGADELVSALGDAGVSARGYYRTPVHHQPAMAPFTAGMSPLPATDELARTNLALPMGASLSAEAIERVAAVIAAFAPASRAASPA
jgi:dTDP-4-amino-4,6-dideoxygalactose transaminase